MAPRVQKKNSSSEMALRVQKKNLGFKNGTTSLENLGFRILSSEMIPRVQKKILGSEMVPLVSERTFGSKMTHRVQKNYCWVQKWYLRFRIETWVEKWHLGFRKCLGSRNVTSGLEKNFKKWHLGYRNGNSFSETNVEIKNGIWGSFWGSGRLFVR